MAPKVCDKNREAIEALRRSCAEIDAAMSAALGDGRINYMQLVGLLALFHEAQRRMRSLENGAVVEKKYGPQECERERCRSRFESTASNADATAKSSKESVLKAAEDSTKDAIEKHRLEDSQISGGVLRLLLGKVSIREDRSINWNGGFWCTLCAWFFWATVGPQGASFWLAVLVPLVAAFMANHIDAGVRVARRKARERLEQAIRKVEEDRVFAIARVDAERADSLARARTERDTEFRRIEVDLTSRLEWLSKTVSELDDLMFNQTVRAQDLIRRWQFQFDTLRQETVEAGGAPSPPEMVCIGELSVSPS